MATRLKTVQYAFPALASLTNNTLTNLTQITVYLPETGTKTFKSVVAHVSMDDIITATGGSITTKTLNLRLGAAGYTSVANGNTLTNSGENISLFLSADYTSHFTTNWTGTSMTCDFQLQINQSTGTTTGMVNVCVTLDITYEYDDTSTTHVKTVMIPLNMPTTTLATVATTYDTIPVLDTYLPESSKTYRGIYAVLLGADTRNAATNDYTLTLRIGAASVTTGNSEGALSSNRYKRYVWDVTSAYPSTAATQTWQPTSSNTGIYSHGQAYLVVTYEFDASATTDVMNSLILPMDIQQPAGGTTSSDYQRGTVDLWIPESSITSNRIAFYAHWSALADVAGLNMRIGTGSFVTYTDTTGASLMSTAMVRNDSAFTLARGRNTLNFDIYRTDTADFAWALSGFWIINYTSAKHADGVGAHNHTVWQSLARDGTGANATSVTVSAVGVTLPESDYFINNIGLYVRVTSNSTNIYTGCVALVERLSGEGGIAWEPIFNKNLQNAAEQATFHFFVNEETLFKRFIGDADPRRFDVETARRWRVHIIGTTASVGAWFSVNALLTYHSIAFDVAGTVSGSGGGTVNLSLHRGNLNAKESGELLKKTTRSGNGSYTFTWYDDTEDVFVEADEDSTHLGRSDTGVAV